MMKVDEYDHLRGTWLACYKRGVFGYTARQGVRVFSGPPGVNRRMADGSHSTPL